MVPEKFRSATSRSARSGWVWSTPVSSTATVTPAPVNPASHAAGAPICGTLWSNDAVRLPSNHTFLIPVPASEPTPVNPLHHPEPADFSTSTATPPTLGRSTVTDIPATAAAPAIRCHPGW